MWHHKGDADRPIGLIAGTGDFPLLVARAAAEKGVKVVAFGVEGYTDGRLTGLVQEARYVRFGALGEVVELLKSSGVRELVMAGGLPKKKIYEGSFQADDNVRGILGGLRENKGDDHILRAFEIFLRVKCKIRVIDPRRFMKDSVARKGCMTSRRPTTDELKDIRFGWKVAKSIGRLDIGQTVVVKNGVVLAVEALEGTDEAIRRAGALGREGAVVVKTSKPRQDLKFDLPCVGPATLETMRSVSSKVLAVEAGKTLFIDQKAFLALAESEGITVVGS